VAQTPPRPACPLRLATLIAYETAFRWTVAAPMLAASPLLRLIRLPGETA